MRVIIGLILFIVFSFSKILIVNSYNEKDQCGMPQLNGFLSIMYKNQYKPEDFDIYFLNARVTTKKELKTKAQKILKNLNKYDYVVTFDDAAFQLIGIPASKKAKIIFFSGLNIPFSIYKQKYNLPDNFSGVYEKLYAKEVLEVFNKIKPINKVALFYSDGVGKIVKNQIISEIKNTPFENKIDLIHIKTLKELKQKTEEINKMPIYTLFVPLTLNLEKKYTFLQIKDIYLKNIKKPDISININFANLGFLGFGGVDFYEMGKQCANLVLLYTKNHIKKIENARAHYFFVNAKRAKEINFNLPKWFMINYLKKIIY